MSLLLSLSQPMLTLAAWCIPPLHCFPPLPPSPAPHQLMTPVWRPASAPCVPCPIRSPPGTTPASPAASRSASRGEPAADTPPLGVTHGVPKGEPVADTPRRSPVVCHPKGRASGAPLITMWCRKGLPAPQGWVPSHIGGCPRTQTTNVF
jgi:hypothetical protein